MKDDAITKKVKPESAELSRESVLTFAERQNAGSCDDDLGLEFLVRKQEINL